MFHRQRPYLARLALATQPGKKGLCGEEDTACSESAERGAAATWSGRASRARGALGCAAESDVDVGTVSYEVGGNVDATCFGGIAAVHRMVTKLGLVDQIDEGLHLLKVHLPYHESDHVLNLAYWPR